MRSAAFCMIALVATPAAAEPNISSQTANSAVGQAGQRQTREEAAPNIKPMGRIDNRIANRVQSRIRNRIDRYYDPQANAASPFVIAGAQARATARPRRR